MNYSSNHNYELTEDYEFKKGLISCEDSPHTLSAEYILACIRRC